MKSCSVPGCKSTFVRGSGLSFHKFPKCPEVKAKWVTAIGRPEGWEPSEFHNVCSNHFPDDDDNFYLPKVDRPRLKPNAVPSLCKIHILSPDTRVFYDNRFILEPILPSLPQEVNAENEPAYDLGQQSEEIVQVKGDEQEPIEDINKLIIKNIFSLPQKANTQNKQTCDLDLHSEDIEQIEEDEPIDTKKLIIEHSYSAHVEMVSDADESSSDLHSDPDSFRHHDEEVYSSDNNAEKAIPPRTTITSLCKSANKARTKRPTTRSSARIQRLNSTVMLKRKRQAKLTNTQKPCKRRKQCLEDCKTLDSDSPTKLRHKITMLQSEVLRQRRLNTLLRVKAKQFKNKNTTLEHLVHHLRGQLGLETSLRKTNAGSLDLLAHACRIADK